MCEVAGVGEVKRHCPVHGVEGLSRDVELGSVLGIAGEGGLLCRSWTHKTDQQGADYNCRVRELGTSFERRGNNSSAS